MTAELGLNLAGVERVLALEEEILRLRRRAGALEAQNKELRAQLAAALSESSFTLDLVPLPGGGTLVRRIDVGPLEVEIPEAPDAG